MAAALNFLCYQCKEHKKLIFVLSLSATSICISYGFLGAWSGMWLNVICITRNIIISNKHIKIFSYAFWPYLLAVVLGIAGAWSWQGPVSLLIIIPLIINTLFLYFPNVQNLRKSILFTSTLVLIYNACYHVWGGVLNEFIAISSSAIGLYRYRKTK